jgi:predicted aldo/keto reductase-like oxidoreductase
MHYRLLGDSELRVSELCLGTMTFGEQNTLEDAKAQLDYAFDAGINFVDAAEIGVVLDKAVLAEIEQIHARYPSPAP